MAAGNIGTSNRAKWARGIDLRVPVILIDGEYRNPT